MKVKDLMSKMLDNYMKTFEDIQETAQTILSVFP